MLLIVAHHVFEIIVERTRSGVSSTHARTISSTSCEVSGTVVAIIAAPWSARISVISCWGATDNGLWGLWMHLDSIGPTIPARKSVV
jgi:hypothetical protein